LTRVLRPPFTTVRHEGCFGGTAATDFPRSHRCCLFVAHSGLELVQGPAAKGLISIIASVVSMK